MTSSDAHFVDDIGTAVMVMRISKATTAEIRSAFLGQEGRSIVG
jgi:hypothetical protein